MPFLSVSYSDGTMESSTLLWSIMASLILVLQSINSTMTLTGKDMKLWLLLARGYVIYLSTRSKEKELLVIGPVKALLKIFLVPPK